MRFNILRVLNSLNRRIVAERVKASQEVENSPEHNYHVGRMDALYAIYNAIDEADRQSQELHIMIDDVEFLDDF